MQLETQTRDRITTIITSAPIVLFMKGSPEAPQCGFSARTVQVLNRVVPSFESFDVLSDPEIREGIKLYSEWPTIPQLYIGGEFQGGCDIVVEMYDNGELHQALGLEPPGGSSPVLTITDEAAAILRNAAQSQPGELHLGVDAAYRHSLYFGPVEPGEIAASSNGFEVFMDRDSAARADGLTLQVRTTDRGPELDIENPNSPQIGSLTVSELQALRESQESILLLDVRTDAERQAANIEGSLLLDDRAVAEVTGRPKDTKLVFFCHHGSRSLAAARQFVLNGFTQVYNLEGGIDAWSREIDPSVPRY